MDLYSHTVINPACKAPQLPGRHQRGVGDLPEQGMAGRPATRFKDQGI